MENTLPKLVFVSYGDILYDNGYKTRLMGELSLATNYSEYKKYLVSFEKPASYHQNSTEVTKLKHELARKDIELIVVPRQNRWQFDFYRDERKFADILREIEFKYGILHGQSLYGTYLCLPYASSRVKVIFDMHGLIGPEWQAMGKNPLKKWINQWLENQCIKYSDHIITASEALKKLIERKYPPKKIDCLPCLVDDKKFPQLSSQTIPYLRKKLNLPEKIITVYAGGMQEWQDFSEIINLHKTHDWHLLILTPDISTAEKIFAEIQDKCTIISVPHHEIYQYLQLADWGWLIRQDNLLNKIAFPTKAAEYLICGLPIVHNGTIADINNLVKRQGLGQNLNHGLDEWIENYLQNQTEIKNRCRQWAKTKLSWTSRRHQLGDVYAKISRKKIYYLITTGFWGGAQKYVLDLANHFSRHHDVTVLIGAHGGKLIRKLKKADIQVELIPSLHRRIQIVDDIKTTWSLYNRWRQEKPDILHINSSKAGVIGRLAGRLAEVENIYFTAHGWVFNEDRNWLVKAFYRGVELFMSWLTDQIFCVSQFDKVTAKKAGIEAAKITVIYNGINDETTNSGFPQRKKIIAWSKKYKIIGNVSNFFANKNILVWLEMVKQATKIQPNWRFVLVGTGPQQDEVNNFISEYNLTDKILLTGQLNSIESIIGYFDVLTLMSKKEGLPYIVLEAMKAKVPVVATAVGGVPEMIDDSFGTLVKINDIPGTIAAINHLLDKKITADLPDKFRLDKMLEQYDNAYR